MSLSATDTGSWLAGTYYRIGGGATTTYTAPFAVNTEGAVDVAYWSVDGAGNVEATKTVTVRYDKTAPSTTGNAPTSWVANSATVSLFPTDASSGVSATYYSLDGGQPAARYTSSLNISTEGTTTLKYYSVDVAGNAETIKSATIRVDRTGPTASDNAPSSWVKGPVTVALSGSDAMSGLSGFKYSLDGSWPSLLTSGTIPVSAEGTTTLRYFAVDNVGFTTETAARQIRIDNTNPVTTSTAQASYMGTATISFSATDALSGVAVTKWRFNGGPWRTEDSTSIAQGGSHKLEFYSTDAAGNAEPIKTVYFDVTVKVDQSDANILYVGNWGTYAHANHYQGAYRYATQNGAAAHIAFTGTAIDWYTYKAPECGIAQVSIDGGDPVDVDLYSAGYYYQQKVFSAKGLSNGPHTMSISFTGRKNASASNAKIGLDRFDVTGELSQARLKYEETDSRYVYRGSWANYGNANHSGGAYRYTNSAGGSVVFAFTGTEFSWYTGKAPDFGIARVTVDGTAPVDVDLYSAGYYYKQKVLSVGGLSAGQHIVTISWTGTKNPAATNTKVGLDYVDVYGSMATYPDGTAPYTSSSAQPKYATSATIYFWANDGSGIGVSGTRWRVDGSAWTTGTTAVVNTTGAHTLEFQSVDYLGNTEAIKSAPFTIYARSDNKDSRILYSGSWSTWASGGFFGGDYKYANKAGSSVTVGFKGTAMDWITSKAPDFGIAKVTLDGGTPAYVDLYAPNYPVQQRVWSANGLEDTTHTVTIEWTGTKNAASSNTKVGIDAVDLLGQLVIPPDTTAPVTTSNAVASYAETATITLSPSDAGGSGLAATKWRLDDGAWNTGTVITTTETGSHTLEFYSIDGSGNEEAVKSVDFALYARFDDAVAGISVPGNWTSFSNANLYRGSYRYTYSSAATLTVSFSGTSVRWITSKAPDCGIASVSIDGGEPMLVDLYSAGYYYKQTAWTSPVLENGAHTMTITWTGTKHPSATSTRVGVDAIDVLGTLATP